MFSCHLFTLLTVLYGTSTLAYARNRVIVPSFDTNQKKKRNVPIVMPRLRHNSDLYRVRVLVPFNYIAPIFCTLTLPRHMRIGVNSSLY